MDKVKLEVSKCLKEFNKRYCRNYTMQDLADRLGVSREALSRASSDSSFSFVYRVAHGIHELYPEVNNGAWDFCLFMEHLFWESHDFNMSIFR